MTGGNIPSAERLMSDSRFIPAERGLQPGFRLASVFRLCLLPFFLLVSSDTRFEGPDRVPAPNRLVPTHFDPVPTGRAGVAKWRVSVADPRFGGVSALAIGAKGLVALTDSGAVIDLPRPGSGGSALVRDLPGGPGSPDWKKFRDSEALVATPQGWWAGFEFRHSLWLYDHDFRHVLRSVRLQESGWRANSGVEALVADGDGLLMLPESGREAVRWKSGKIERFPLEGARGAPADAARLPDGAILVTIRSFGLTGIHNRIARLERTTRGYRLDHLADVPVGRLDNVEGMAAEPRADGTVRLWLITDNDFIRWRDTKLVALDLPAD